MQLLVLAIAPEASAAGERTSRLAYLTLYDLDLMVDSFDKNTNDHLRAPMERAPKPDTAPPRPDRAHQRRRLHRFARVVRLVGGQWSRAALLEEMTGDIDDMVKLVPGAAEDGWCDVLDE